MAADPPIAVAVVSWNTRDLLDACLASLKPAVDDGLAEVWVVDNASEDGSPELVRDHHPWVKLEARPDNLGFGKANIVSGSVAGVLQRPPSAPYDVAFLDPPYAVDDDTVARSLRDLVDHDWLVPGAMVVVERSSRSPEPAWPTGFTAVRRKRYGETTLWYGHAASPASRRPAWPGPASSEE